MATMLDVSIRAGVSKATVSRVLNGTGQVKESTRQQVFKAMEELGYRPNFRPFVGEPHQQQYRTGGFYLDGFILAACYNRLHARRKSGENS